MIRPKLSRETFDRLSAPGSRIDWLRDWLLECVWSSERYNSMAAGEYLEQGEKEVNEIEEVIAAAAPRVYDELLGGVPERCDVQRFLNERRPCAVVVFDGLSLREVPLLLRLAEKSGLSLAEPIDFSFSAVPSGTVEFIEQRLGFGRTSPSALHERRALSDRGITAYYYDSVSRRFRLDDSAEALLLWSSFPDHSYSDSGARFKEHFEQMHVLLETAWKNTVQQIPAGRNILITSDHGYVYFGSGMSFSRSNAAMRPLTQYFGGERFKRTSEAGPPPEHPDLVELRDRDLAIIRGRAQTHPPGPQSSRLYKHGGLSIMEVLVPWVLLTSSGA
ncbi:MAG TPA: hypothetical protein VJH03_16150 [Blastocatellia bacterium]|nr:hypothetical protein [Blastocatellia bacterium]